MEKGGDVLVATRFAQVLRSLGVQQVYGLPGEDHMTLLDAIDAAGIDYCAAFNESSAALMAGAHAQVTGRPGVVILSLAPGASNGVNGLLNAFMDEIPLVVISGQHPAAQQPFVVRQAGDLERLLAPVTKWSTRITGRSDVTAALCKAFDVATSGRRGPVYVELPDEVATLEASPSRSDLAAEALATRWTSDQAGRSEPPIVSALDEIAARLAESTYPALVVGGRRPILPDAVHRFASAYRCPVFSTSAQKGVIDSTDPWFAGTFLNGSLEGRLLDRADFVLMISPEAFDHYNRPWSFKADAAAVTDDLFTEWLHDFAIRAVADGSAALNELAARAGAGSDWSRADVAAYRQGLRETLLGTHGGGMSVAHAVDAALRPWPRDGYLVADAGFSKPLVAMLAEPAVAGHYLASNGLSTMGYTIPAAVAARRASRRPVLAFLGDGSLMMRATELMVSADDGVPSVFVAMMDRSLTQIEVKQERRQLREVGVTLPPVSCARLADALGIAGCDVDSADELERAVAAGMRDTRPHLVGALVDPAASRPLFEVLRG